MRSSGEREKQRNFELFFYGSAKSPRQEHSVNDCLPTGPNYVPQLADVLVRFRWNPVAISADIEKAFLMISIQKDQRDMLCFLWFKDPYVLNSEVLQLRFCRLVFGLRPSPAVLGATLTHHLNAHKEQYPEVVEQIRSSLYVDDMLSGAEWNSNSPELRHLINKKEAETVVQPKTKEPSQAVKEEDESFTKSTTGPNQVSYALVKTLGVCWDTASDEISFDFTDLIECANAMKVAKRSLLKLSAKVFDLLGLLSPFTIMMKCQFQSLCLEKLDWDVELQGNYVQLWKSFVSRLIHLNSVHVPRCYFSSSATIAYASAVYLRSEYRDGSVDIKLVSSKTRVAPMKQQTIPRLELLGALISARLVSSLMKQLPQEIKPTFWVDSTTVLY